MSKHYEKMHIRDIPALLKSVSRNMTPDTIGERVPCPTCDGQMFRVDNGDFPWIEPTGYGGVKYVERFICVDCETYADFTQYYIPEPNNNELEVFVAVED